MKRLLFSILFLLFPILANAQEVIVSYDKSSLSVLNEELRGARTNIASAKGSISALQSVVGTIDNLKVGTDTKLLTSMEAQTITLGFKPRAVIVIAGITSNSSTAASIGFSDGINNYCQFNNYYSGAGATGVSATTAIEFKSSALGAYLISATISFTDNGFIINWASAYGTPNTTARVSYIAI